MKRNLLPILILILSPILIGYGCTSEPDEPYTDNSCEDTDKSNTQGDVNNISDTQIRKIIEECVSVNAKYEDYMWYFTIESTLHNKLPNKKIKFGIGHGDINGSEEVSVEEQAFEYSCQINGEKKTVLFTNPFWFYYVFGVRPSDKENWTRSEMYHASYKFLKEKGYTNLNKDEKELYNNLREKLNELERPAILYYKPSVEVLIDSKFYLIKRYK